MPKATASVTTLSKARMRSHTFGNFRLVIIPKSDPDVGNVVKWRKGATVEGTVYFENKDSVTPRACRAISTAQYKSVRALIRNIFNRVWDILYDYAVLLNDKKFQVTYLKHRIKIHGRWRDFHAKEFTCHNKLRDKEYVEHNTKIVENLHNRLKVLEY